MRFCYGSVPETPGFRPEAEGWQPLREPGPWLLQVLAFVPAIILLAMDIGLLGLAWPEGFAFGKAFTAFSLLGLLAVILASVLLHELLHVVFHPGGGLTSSSVLGAWPSKGLFYAHYDGPSQGTARCWWLPPLACSWRLCQRCWSRR